MSHVRGLTYVFIAGSALRQRRGFHARVAARRLDPGGLAFAGRRGVPRGAWSPPKAGGSACATMPSAPCAGCWCRSAPPATICYIFALTITTVANVMIVYATTPFVTAVVAWIWVREAPSRRMLVASSMALVGVAIMLGGGGAASRSELVGAGLILFMNVSFALLLVLARRDPKRSMTPVNALSLLLASLVELRLRAGGAAVRSLPRAAGAVRRRHGRLRHVAVHGGAAAGPLVRGGAHRHLATSCSAP